MSLGVSLNDANQTFRSAQPFLSPERVTQVKLVINQQLSTYEEMKARQLTADTDKLETLHEEVMTHIRMLESLNSELQTLVSTSQHDQATG